ncbi:hypothetical protein [Bacillus cereus]|nr:hypothetical protein [Bacillus cereus]
MKSIFMFYLILMNILKEWSNESSRDLKGEAQLDKIYGQLRMWQ